MNKFEVHGKLVIVRILISWHIGTDRSVPIFKSERRQLKERHVLTALNLFGDAEHGVITVRLARDIEEPALFVEF
jgi:hypothetical protein